jgi:hypothetical protein
LFVFYAIKRVICVKVRLIGLLIKLFKSCSKQIDCPIDVDNLPKLDNLPILTKPWIQIRNELLDSLYKIIKEKYINVKISFFFFFIQLIL